MSDLAWGAQQNQPTENWFAHPERRRRLDAFRHRLDALSPPSIAHYTLPSPDGRWLVQALADAATDTLTWRIEAAHRHSDAAPPDILRGVYPTGIAWLPDGRGLFYDRPLPFGGHGLYYHRPGLPQDQDLCIFYQPEHPEQYYQPFVSPDGKWLAVSILNGSAANRLALLRLAGRIDDSAYIHLIPRFVGRYDPLHWTEDELICRAVEADAPNGRLIAFPLPDQPGDSPPRRVLLPPVELPLIDATPFGDGWAIHYLDGGAAALRLVDAQGNLRDTLPLPGLGTVEWLETVETEVQLLRFAYSDFARPPAVYTWQPGQSALTGGLYTRIEENTDQSENPRSLPSVYTKSSSPVAHGSAWESVLDFDPDSFVTRRDWIAGPDGARIPLFLAHRKDVTPADRPTLLHAYGGLGHRLTPHFSPDAALWLEMGGVYAIVCARGGGELGAHWHQAAVGPHKQRTFDDVLAAASWLVETGITTPARLGLWGTSNGGLTAGACLTQQPDIFGAVVIESGLLDMLDYHRLGRGAGWLAEYGNPDNPAHRTFLAAYSPLHNIQPGRVYPPVLIATHQHDSRVGESHSLRFAQALAQGGDAPVLLRVHPGSGHGPQDNAWAAERLAFLSEHLGIEQ